MEYVSVIWGCHQLLYRTFFFNRGWAVPLNQMVSSSVVVVREKVTVQQVWTHMQSKVNQKQKGRTTSWILNLSFWTIWGLYRRRENVQKWKHFSPCWTFFSAKWAMYGKSLCVWGCQWPWHAAGNWCHMCLMLIFTVKLKLCCKVALMHSIVG